jgi:hypothetical protein
MEFSSWVRAEKAEFVYVDYAEEKEIPFREHSENAFPDWIGIGMCNSRSDASYDSIEARSGSTEQDEEQDEEEEEEGGQSQKTKVRSLTPKERAMTYRDRGNPSSNDSLEDDDRPWNPPSHATTESITGEYVLLYPDVSDPETEGRIAGSNRDPPGNSTRREFVKDGSQTPKWGLANVMRPGFN